jgi:hypothetical protein
MISINEKHKLELGEKPGAEEGMVKTLAAGGKAVDGHEIPICCANSATVTIRVCDRSRNAKRSPSPVMR